MADTLTAFETLKYNLSGLTSEADPNRKALDGLTASEIKKAAGPMCKTLPRESLSPMRIQKVFGQDKKGTRPLTPRDKSWLLAMTWWRESMREGSRTGFRPNRARSQRVQSNSVMSLRAGSSLKGMDGRRLNSERGPLYIDMRSMT